MGWLSFKKTHPNKKYIYAITTGAFVGELLAYMETDENNYIFLSMPAMSIREIPKDKFSLGMQNKIVDIVQEIPTSIYNVCLAQYKKNKKGK